MRLCILREMFWNALGIPWISPVYDNLGVSLLFLESLRSTAPDSGVMHYAFEGMS